MEAPVFLWNVFFQKNWSAGLVYQHGVFEGKNFFSIDCKKRAVAWCPSPLKKDFCECFGLVFTWEPGASWVQGKHAAGGGIACDVGMTKQGDIRTMIFCRLT